MDTTSHGVRISYDDLGKGEPALLLLTGWCANRTTMYRQILAACSKSRRTLALDWRGHGLSATPKGDFGADDLVRDALALIEASGAQHVVLVATAHAGWMAIELRSRLAERIPKIILLEWIVLEAPPPFLRALRGLQDPQQWEQARAALLYVAHRGGQPRCHSLCGRDGAYGFEMWARAGREILASYARAGSPLKALAELNPPVPTLHLYSQPADPGYLAAQEAFDAEHHWFQVRRLPARSHFPMLEVPEVVVAEIEDFVAS